MLAAAADRIGRLDDTCLAGCGCLPACWKKGALAAALLLLLLHVGSPEPALLLLLLPLALSPGGCQTGPGPKAEEDEACPGCGWMHGTVSRSMPSSCLHSLARALVGTFGAHAFR